MVAEVEVVLALRPVTGLSMDVGTVEVSFVCAAPNWPNAPPKNARVPRDQISCWQ